MKKAIMRVFLSAVAMFSFASFGSDAVFPVQAGVGVAATCVAVTSYKDATFCQQFHDTVICNCDNLEGKFSPVFCKTVQQIANSAKIYGDYLGICKHNYGKNADPTVLTECVNQWSCALTGVSTQTDPATGKPYVCSGNPTPGSACPNINS